MTIEPCPFCNANCTVIRKRDELFSVWCVGGCGYWSAAYPYEDSSISAHNAIARDHADGEKRREET